MTVVLKWGKLVVLVVAAMAIGWVALRSAAPRAFAAQTGLPERLDPGNPDLLFRTATEEMLRSRGHLPDRFYPQLAEAGRRDPLAAEPFLFFGLRALEQRNLAHAERLLIEARRRDPRLRLARLALLGTYLQTNRIAEASSESAVSVRLTPRAQEALVAELARLAASTEPADAVVRAIGDDPLMEPVLTQLAQSEEVEPEHVLRLAARQPRTPHFDTAGWPVTLLSTMVRRGEVQRAHAIWRRLAGITGTPALLHDPRFQGRPGALPFNWVLSTSGGGTAERSAGGALDVQYYGREATQLAAQLLVLPPGRYQLSMQVEGETTDQGSRLEWQVTCTGSDAVLLAAPLRGITYTPRGFTAAFTVPASGCSGQWLRLQGLPAEFPSTQAVKISELALGRTNQ